MAPSLSAKFICSLNLFFSSVVIVLEFKFPTYKAIHSVLNEDAILDAVLITVDDEGDELIHATIFSFVGNILIFPFDNLDI